jgi:CheY-like chemotaxis protein
VCCAADVTEIRRAHEALAKAQKMESLGMLSGGIAHDFNNIFQAMVANLEMAQASVLEESRGQAYLERLKTGLDRASRLSRDLLHSSGGDLRRPESIGLTPLLTEVLDGMGLTVLRDFAPDLPQILVDPLLVSRVVEGLVTNALEASSAEGAIRLRTCVRNLTPRDLDTGHWPEPLEPGTYVVMEVSDQGHGIDQATLSKIFDPFFSTRDLGRGLGLAAALGIIRGHRGGIQVESLPGVGSVFRVYFPSPEGQEVAPMVAGLDVRARNLVLLVDDEAELRAVMAEMLQDWFGLDVVSAADGQEAVEIFTQRPGAFDLVILDATMPRLGGVEAFRAMRAIRPGLPGILCSGYALPASRDQAIAQGFADFLKKPFTSTELEALLDRVVGTRMK